jgi:hypothetical protein
MAFNNKRGRPCSKHVERSDLGTPELIKKRLHDVTTEALDICLRKNLISPEQHWCGIHLRWLYTLRYGVPSVKALDPTHLGGRELNSDNPEWRKEREIEYQEALHAMGKSSTVNSILELCVFNQRPIFLRSKHSALLEQAKRTATRSELELAQIHLGLNALINLWCKKSI